MIATLAHATDGVAQGAGAELVVLANGFESTDGQATIILVSSAQSWDTMIAKKGNSGDRSTWKNHHAVADVPIAQQGATGVRFTGLDPGEYAVMVVHDANGNQKLDRKPGFMGRMMPAEDIGVSNDYRISMPPRPPSWDDVKITVQPGANQTELRMGMMR